jgi:large subunit ribosomal protein L4
MSKIASTKGIVDKSTPNATLEGTKVTADAFGEVTRFNIKSLVELVVSRNSNKHHHTANVKTRGEVAGSTKKPWRQKGTGRARVGTKRTPLWRGGGRIFGPTSDRNYQKKINRGLTAPTLKWALQQKAESGKIEKISNLETIDSAKTKQVLAMLSVNLHTRGTLVITGKPVLNLKRALSNVSFINIKSADQLNFLDVTNARYILITEAGLNVLQSKFK